MPHENPFFYDSFDYNALSTMLKYEVAVENTKLIARRINSDHLAIQRLKGVTQSFDMYDSQFYRKAKSVLKEINKWENFIFIVDSWK